MLMHNSSPTHGLNVLVVEDETLVLFNLEDILTELGCLIVGPAMRLPQAQQLAERRPTSTSPSSTSISAVTRSSPSPNTFTAATSP